MGIRWKEAIKRRFIEIIDKAEYAQEVNINVQVRMDEVPMIQYKITECVNSSEVEDA